jgi:maltooligosyltrehalose trehalohydrolase
MLGAIPVSDGLVRCTVWAPSARRVSVLGSELEPGDDAVFSGDVPASPGDDYRYRLDGGIELPDPCSRWQPDGMGGPSRVLDTSSFAIRPGPRLDTLVIYELHIGTFSPDGTFDGARRALDDLAAAGVTAIEPMPVATFPGERGWGYDGVYTSAPHRAYGGPHGLARLIDAAHEAGLGVILDVVYNHIGPGSEALTAFGPYFAAGATPWGRAVDYSLHGVREWAIQNAELWVRDYRVDGLRLDAVNAIVDDGPEHVCAELKRRVGDAIVISETEIGDRRPIDDWGHDAQWDDSLHHALHALLTGEHDGYYAGLGSLDDVVRALRAGTPQLVACAQNHDQVGNRALGDRLSPEQDRVALATVLFARSTPLVFMGEEYGETHPFQFFTDHTDPAIAEATREGRRREFAEFESFGGTLPDPQSPEAFERSRLDRKPTAGWFRRAAEVRPSPADSLEVEVVGELALRLHRGGRTLTVDFGALTLDYGS